LDGIPENSVGLLGRQPQPASKNVINRSAMDRFLNLESLLTRAICECDDAAVALPLRHRKIGFIRAF
jgi:hypothetical protein